MACAKSSSLTDGARRRLMMPLAKTVGTNVSCTPKGLYSVVMIGTPPVLPGCAVGTGNSPPARKEAVSPESATKSGSARRRMRPFVSSADRVTSRLPPLVARLASATPKGAAPESKVPAVLNIGRPGAPLPVGEPGAGTGFPLASTQGGVPQPETLRRADSRSAPRGGRAQAGREASVPRVVCPKPIHPDFAARAAGDLKKSDPEHHLLRRGDFHRIHDVRLRAPWSWPPPRRGRRPPNCWRRH